MIHDPFDSNKDRLSVSDAMMGDPRAEMRFGRFSSLDDDNLSAQWQRPAVSLGFIDYILDGSIPLLRRARNIVLWLLTVVVLIILVSIGVTKLTG